MHSRVVPLFQLFLNLASLQFPFTDPTFPTKMRALPTSSQLLRTCNELHRNKGLVLRFLLFCKYYFTIFFIFYCARTNDTRQLFMFNRVCYFFLARPPCFDFSIASLTCRSSWSLMDWLTISSSEQPDSRAHSGRSDSGKKGVSVPVVPIRRTFRFKSILHYVKKNANLSMKLTFLQKKNNILPSNLLLNSWLPDVF